VTASRTVLAAAAAVALAGCKPRPAGTRTPGGGAAAEPDRFALERVRIDPSRQAVARYGDALRFEPNVLEREVEGRLRAAGLHGEPALHWIARELGRTTPSTLAIPPELVDALMSWFGLADPAPRVVVVELAAERSACITRPDADCGSAVDSLVEQVVADGAPKSDLAVGVGAALGPGGTLRIVVAMLERGVVLERFPRALPSRGGFTLRGRLLGSRAAPSLEVVDPTGHGTRMPARSGNSGALQADFRCVRDGAYQVELLADGRHGPEVVANFPVWCGIMPADHLFVDVEHVAPDATAEEVERAVFEYLNAERVARGLSVLRWDRRAADVARAHSEDMVRSGFVGHRSPTTGDVTDRFRRARVRGTVIRENVARGYGPAGIHNSLLRSPGHRVNMLAEDVTHAGVGVIIAPPETDAVGAPRPMYATQNLFRDPAAGDPVGSDPHGALARQIEAGRRAAGVAPLSFHPGLAREATRQARALAQGRDPGTDPQFDKELAAAGITAVARHHVESPDFAALARLPLWRELPGGEFPGGEFPGGEFRGGMSRSVGFGVAAKKTSEGRTWILVVLVPRT
jgi:uncharacterized protein YkwD